MTLIKNIFGVQQVYANDIYDCTINNDCPTDNNTTNNNTVPGTPPPLNTNAGWESLQKYTCEQKYGQIYQSWTGNSNDGGSCLCKDSSNKSVACTTLSQDYLTQKLCGGNAPKYSIWDINQGACICAAGLTDDGSNECINNAYGTLGVSCSPQQMRNGTCSWNINKTLRIKESNTSSTPTLFVQDIVLAATSFIGTLMVIALIVMGFKYVMGGMDESSTGDLKGNIKKLLIGLGLVIGSYTIIRLIQYVARGY